jgi:hypothetical protein
MRSLLNLIAVLLIIQPTAAHAGPVEATGLDAITTPGQRVTIRAKFERKGIGPIQPDITNRRVTFTVLQESHGDLTDSDGIAQATVTPITTGVFAFQAKLNKSRALPATGRLFVVSRDTPVAVVDIDGTISAGSAAALPFRQKPAETFEGAPRLLTDLARTHQIVYLTARDDHYASATRRFLAHHRFPAGPVLYNTWGLVRKKARSQLVPGNHGAFKLRRINRLKSSGLRIAMGIGNAETDALAYEKAQLNSYILTEAKSEGPSFRFTHYAQLRRRLTLDGLIR